MSQRTPVSSVEMDPTLGHYLPIRSLAKPGLPQDSSKNGARLTKEMLR
jgi:hypothetical protein